MESTIEEHLLNQQIQDSFGIKNTENDQQIAFDNEQEMEDSTIVNYTDEWRDTLEGNDDIDYQSEC